MATSEEVRPIKGILKRSSSLDQKNDCSRNKEMTWDEMNILATHHPPDKDYGHMKIDEPPTPYNKQSDVEDEDVDGESQRRGSVGHDHAKLDASSLASRLSETMEAKITRHPDVLEDEDDDDEEEDETEEEQEHRHKFELKRKLHYNEFQAVQLAKKLMAEEEDEDDDENDENKMEETSQITPEESTSN